MADELTYKYLSDGTKLSVKKSDGSSIIYRGSFVYDVSADGIVTLESVGIPEGRVYCIDTPDGELWECWDVKDYLGNVRAVVRSNNGSTIKINDYLPYGTKIEEYSTSYQVGHNRWHYAGKEHQDFGGSDDVKLIDFGSRYYSPGLGRWTATDPQSWKYSSASPYNYCNNNPVNFVDPNGEDPKRRVFFARSFLGVPYDNDEGKLRTEFTKEALANMDCSEFVSRILYLDGITQTSTGMCTMNMKEFFFDETKFQNDFTPQEGDIVFWGNHVGLVTEVSKDGKAKVIQASSRQKKVIETVVFCPVDRIKGFATGSFYGFFRPKEESFNEKLEPAVVVSDKKELVNIISSALAGDSNIIYIVK